jgi:hypothetical protein
MKAELSEALRELELSTDALLEVDVADVGRLCGALDRRARAVARVAALGEELTREGTSAVRRLSAALNRGNEVTRRVVAMKQEAAEEWKRYDRIGRNMKEGRAKAAPKIDYSG